MDERTVPERVQEIQTPALLVEKSLLEENLQQMDRLLAASPMALYPHYKSHKCPQIARMQLARGAAGITCAKLSEAEDLAAAGIETIVIANQIVQREKLARLAELAQRCRVTVCVDCPEHILMLEQAMAKRDAMVRVLVEYDVGMGRCGVDRPEDFLALAQLTDRQPHLRFEGIQAYAGQLSHEVDGANRQRELSKIEETVRQLKSFVESHGLPVDHVCGGSTGTAGDKPADTAYTQLQAGSYLFLDATYQTLGLAFRPALFLLMTVLSVKDDHVVLDGGVKSLSMDQQPPSFPDFPGARVELHEEHTLLSVPRGCLNLGDQVRCIPDHCCTTVNLHDQLYLVEGETVLDLWKVTSRGKAQ